jgi:hypothetical protein
MLGKCEICGSELTIQNSEPFAEHQQVRVRHVPGNCAQVLYSKLGAAQSEIDQLRTRQPLVVERSEYTVDGGRVLDEMSGTSRIDLVGGPIAGGMQRGVHLFIPKSELGLYPIGAKVRVQVERL